MNTEMENEITVRIICSQKELIDLLVKKGFCESRKFTLDDCYLIPNNIDIDKYLTRELLAKAIIIRKIVIDDKNIINKIIYKVKTINKKGEILSQKSIGCDVLNIEETIDFFKAIGYRVIMEIKEKDIIYSKDNLELAIKLLHHGKILIELETNKKDSDLNTIEKLKNKIQELNLPIKKNTYFVKKAEEALDELLNKKS